MLCDDHVMWQITLCDGSRYVTCHVMWRSCCVTLTLCDMFGAITLWNCHVMWQSHCVSSRYVAAPTQSIEQNKCTVWTPLSYLHIPLSYFFPYSPFLYFPTDQYNLHSPTSPSFQIFNSPLPTFPLPYFSTFHLTYCPLSYLSTLHFLTFHLSTFLLSTFSLSNLTSLQISKFFFFKI